MKNCLIGYSGLIGSTLLKSNNFDYLYRKSDIYKIKNNKFDFVICAGAPAEKWKANLNPLEDSKNINLLINNLKNISARRFILISTVDVFKNPIGVYETSRTSIKKNNAYGKNRRLLEIFVRNKFNNHNIIRLPALVGDGLKKNALFDIKNNNNINLIDSRNSYQFYPLKNLWKDITKTLELKKKVMHLTSEPISIKSIYTLILKKKYENHVLKKPIAYDFKSIHSENFYGLKNYQYNKTYILKSILNYLKN